MKKARIKTVKQAKETPTMMKLFQLKVAYISKGKSHQREVSGKGFLNNQFFSNQNKRCSLCKIYKSWCKRNHTPTKLPPKLSKPRCSSWQLILSLDSTWLRLADNCHFPFRIIPRRIKKIFVGVLSKIYYQMLGKPGVKEEKLKILELLPRFLQKIILITRKTLVWWDKKFSLTSRTMVKSPRFTVLTVSKVVRQRLHLICNLPWVSRLKKFNPLIRWIITHLWFRVSRPLQSKILHKESRLDRFKTPQKKTNQLNNLLSQQLNNYIKLTVLLEIILGWPPPGFTLELTFKTPLSSLQSTTNSWICKI